MISRGSVGWAVRGVPSDGLLRAGPSDNLFRGCCGCVFVKKNTWFRAVLSDGLFAGYRRMGFRRDPPDGFVVGVYALLGKKINRIEAFSGIRCAASVG